MSLYILNSVVHDLLRYCIWWSLCFVRVQEDYQRCAYCFADRSRPQSVHSRDLNTNNWTSFAAPPPSSVNWSVSVCQSNYWLISFSELVVWGLFLYRDNLGKTGWTWYLRALIVNVLLLGVIAALAAAIIALNLDLLILQRLEDVRSTNGKVLISCLYIHDYLAVSRYNSNPACVDVTADAKGGAADDHMGRWMDGLLVQVSRKK